MAISFQAHAPLSTYSASTKPTEIVPTTDQKIMPMSDLPMQASGFVFTTDPFSLGSTA